MESKPKYILVTHYDMQKRYVGPWEISDERVINLLQPKDLLALDNDTIVYCINGDSSKLSECGEFPNFDTRGGFTAWGYLQEPQNNPPMGSPLS